MNIQEAESLAAELKSRYQDGMFFGDIYLNPQDMSSPETEYDVYLEYEGVLNLEKVGELVTDFPLHTITIASQTRQIIIQ